MNRKRALLVSMGVSAGMMLGMRAMAGEEERVASLRATQTLFDAGQYEDALDAVNLAIEYTHDAYGDKSAELIEPLLQLGDIQRKLKHPERGIEAYEQASDLIELTDGVFSDRLVGVLRRIGAAYEEEKHGDEAAAALQHAKVITHRNHGIMNLEQVPIIDDLTEVYVDNRDLVSANREQTFALRVNERRFGADSPGLLPGLYRVAAWYRRTHQWTAARDLYRRAAQIIETAYGADDLQLVPALTGIADTYRGERSFRNEGRDSLERAAQVYDAPANAETADVADHGASLIALGDWYMMTNHRDDAIRSYTQAWQLLSGDGTTVEQAQKQLGRATRLRYDPPAPEVPLTPVSPTDKRDAHYIVVQFTVNAEGVVEDPQVIKSNASNRVNRQVRLAVLQARYRPAFVDGHPVSTRVRIRQVYYEAGATPGGDKPVQNAESTTLPPSDDGDSSGEVQDMDAGEDAAAPPAATTAPPPEASPPENP